MAPEFRHRDFALGIAAGLNEAKRLVVAAQAPVTTAAAHPSTADPQGNVDMLFIISLLIIGCGVVTFVVLRRRNEKQSDNEAASSYRSSSYSTKPKAFGGVESDPAPRRPLAGYYPQYPQKRTVFTPRPIVPAPAPTVVVQSNNNTSLTDALIVNELLHDHHHDEPVRHSDPAPSRRDPDPDPPSYGGGSSSWDSGSSSSWDSGGSSSFDFGGGGGGSSDW